jgi:hypothetical protein
MMGGGGITSAVFGDEGIDCLAVEPRQSFPPYPLAPLENRASGIVRRSFMRARYFSIVARIEFVMSEPGAGRRRFASWLCHASVEPARTGWCAVLQQIRILANQVPARANRGELNGGQGRLGIDATRG